MTQAKRTTTKTVMKKRTMFVTPTGHRVTVQPHAANDPAVNVVVLAEATRLASEIHKVLKRGRPGHGLIGNLKCILDHVCRDGDPVPL